MTTTDTSKHHDHPGPHHGHDQIHFFVDGEPHTTEEESWTPNEIIRKFAEKDPASNYLVQIHGHERTSYEGHGDKPIKLRNGIRFQVISTGPTQVSDGRP